MNIVTAAEMKSLDRKATSKYKIPSLLLMENAASGLVDRIEHLYFPVAGKRLTIVAGRGNNGGDGLAAARHLRMRGASVVIYLLSSSARVTGDARVSLEIWQKTGGVLHEKDAFSLTKLEADLKESDLVLDAMLGTGLSHPITGLYAEVIAVMNQYGKTLVSVDIPSGISADTGEIFGAAIKADTTLTMALPKRGHFVQEGLTHCGVLKVVDIGLPPELIEDAHIDVSLITPEHIKELIPAQDKDAHKGRMGHLLVLAGALGKSGAARLTSLAALRSGAGLVTTVLPESIEQTVSSQTMEIMTVPLPESDEGTVALSAEKTLSSIIKGKKSLAIGPGLSQDQETQHLVLRLISTVVLPMVIDADGINAVAVDLSILKQKKGALILTPHPGEMGRLLGMSAAEVQKDRFNISVEFAKVWGVILVLKGPHTLVASPDGEIWVNSTGNPGMATAGVGDALTGVIGAWLARGLAPLDAAVLGVALHGYAGDLAAEEKGESGLIASDLINKIPDAILAYA